MPQLVGSPCVICQKRIGSILEGRFCPGCRYPVHNACASAAVSDSAAGRCSLCGAALQPDLQSEASKAQERFRAPLQEQRPGSTVCPECGSAEYTRRRPKNLVAFRVDRVCRRCGTRYTPPTPRWAAIIFLVAGLLLASFGVLEFGLMLMHANVAAVPGMACDGFLAILGALALIHGIRSLAKPPPEDWGFVRPGESSVDQPGKME